MSINPINAAESPAPSVSEEIPIWDTPFWSSVTMTIPEKSAQGRSKPSSYVLLFCTHGLAEYTVPPNWKRAGRLVHRWQYWKSKAYWGGRALLSEDEGADG
jgi:hypothetical protein